MITVDCDLHGVSGVAITRIPEGFQAAADGPMTQRSDDGLEYATMQSFVSSGFRVPGANGPQPGTVTVLFFSNGTNAENFEANLSPGATTGVPAPDRGEETTEIRVGERPGTLRDSLRKLPIAGGEAAVPDSTLTMRLSSSAGVRILGEGVPGSVLVRFAEGLEAQR